MTDNPFESPVVAAVNAEADEAASTVVKRPLGITILAVLHSIGGITYLVSGVGLLLSKGIHDTTLNGVLPSSALLAAWSVFFTLLFTSSGIGLGLGKAWAWWISASYYLFALMVIGVHLGNDLVFSGVGGASFDFYLVQYGLPLVVGGLICAYFFRTNVLTYFRLDRWLKRKLLGVVVAVAVLLFVVATIATTVAEYLAIG